MAKVVPLLNADFGTGSVNVPGTTHRVGRLYVGGNGNGAVEKLALDTERMLIVAENHGKRRIFPFAAAIGGVEELPQEKRTTEEAKA